MKGRAAVKDIVKLQLFDKDTTYGDIPTDLIEYAKEFTRIQNDS